MIRYKSSSVVSVVAVLGLWLAALLGWVLNIVKLFETFGDPITGKFVLRCVGVLVAPVGTILGYL